MSPSFLTAPDLDLLHVDPQCRVDVYVESLKIWVKAGAEHD